MSGQGAGSGEIDKPDQCARGNALAEPKGERLSSGEFDLVCLRQPVCNHSGFHALRARTSVPIVSEDERLTSREAESRLAVRERDWRRRKKTLDAAAAAIILQDYLDRREPSERRELSEPREPGEPREP